MQQIQIQKIAKKKKVCVGRRAPGAFYCVLLLCVVLCKKNATKKGGGIIPQDLLNLGRGMTYGLGSAYNGLAGYASPVNPMPWKGQLPNTPSLSTVRAASL